MVSHDGRHELVTAPGRSQPRGIGAEPVGQLLGVDDVGARQRPAEAAVAIAEQAGHATRERPRQAIERRPRLDRLERDPLEVPAVQPALQHCDVEALETLPRRQLPRRRLVAANDNDARGDHRGTFTCVASTLWASERATRRRCDSQAAAPRSASAAE